MGFEALLGNETLKQRLTASFGSGKTSHCYLITGPIGSGKKTLVKLMAAALQCTSESKPCCRCPQCHKALNGTHPDVITVDVPERVTIPVDAVRDACSDLYIRPNEGRKKIYLFPRAQALNVQGQNALLKCIEEPPSYGVFIFLCEHADRMLPTIRSRCVELRLAPLNKELLRQKLREACPTAATQAIDAAILQSGGYLGRALELLQEEAVLLPQSTAFVEAYCSGESVQLLRTLAPMEKLKRDQLRPVLAQWYAMLTSALSAHSGLPVIRPECEKLARSRSLASILAAVDAVKKAQTLLEANVGPAHICGALAIELQA